MELEAVLDDLPGHRLVVDPVVAGGPPAQLLLAENVLNQAAALGSPGLDDCAWIKPAFPGDVLSGRYTCTGKRVMRSRPDVGVCQFAFETLNQNGEVIMTWKAALFFQVRAPGAAS